MDRAPAPVQRKTLFWRKSASPPTTLTLLFLSAAMTFAGPQEFQNSLGMKFHSVPGLRVLFSVWETRRADWNAYLSAQQIAGAWNHRPPFPQTDEHPVVNVTVSEAGEFCDWLTCAERASRTISKEQTYRLPTNTEWDAAVGLASREDANLTGTGRESRLYPWGTEWPPPPEAGNYNREIIEGAADDGYKFTAPVGRFEASPDGLFDLGGNVWEWVVNAAADGSLASCLRGGSWMYWRKECLESAFQFHVKPTLRAPSVGFRCVLADEGDEAVDRMREVAGDEAKRRELQAKPKVSEEEMRAMASRFAAHRPANGSENGALPSLAPDGGVSLSIKEWENSLGIKMIRLPEGDVLLGRHEVRIKDFNLYARQNDLPMGDLRDAESDPDRPVTGIAWTQAVAFCLWLTQQERAKELLPPGASYRLPTLAEWKSAMENSRMISAVMQLQPRTATMPGPGGIALSGVLAEDHSEGLLAGNSLQPKELGFFERIRRIGEWCQDVQADTANQRFFRGIAAEEKWDAGSDDDVQRVPSTETKPNVGFRLALEFRLTGQVSHQSPRKTGRTP
ncbi:MAG TPA: SUMF1/EgtB/PvdO family nonheme iron enzyme [Verrucomicrobiaceae bacterium]